MFDALDEEEYQPTYDYASQNYQEETKANKSGHPLGFGAERANLMQEEPVYMP